MDFSLLAAEPAFVQLHLAAALIALVLGTVMVAARKGTAGHRALGRIWVALMAAVALSSFWITGLAGPGRFSVIHLLSVVTLAGLAVAIWAIRTGRVRLHRRAMIGLYAGGLIGAGAGAFWPGRLLSHMLGYG
jgi:uncharacterized membrane protein